VEARLRQDPAAPGYAYGPVSLMAILHEQMGLAFARQGAFREADDHFSEALRQDDRFYQASFDRALVLLRLGRSDDALDSFLLSERWAPSGLPAAQRREFLSRLLGAAEAEGRPSLAAAARAARDR
jgi:tetratricopeptide (TPR) repeat protein